MEKEILFSTEQIVLYIQDQAYRYYLTFQSYNKIAQFQFVSRLWQAQRQTNIQRIDLINNIVEVTKNELSSHLTTYEKSTELWNDVRSSVKAISQNIPQPIFDSFFYKLEQALYPIIDIYANVPFIEPKKFKPTQELLSISGDYPFQDLSQSVIEATGFKNEYENKAEDINRLSQVLKQKFGQDPIHFKLFPSLFYRNQHAYLVGLIKQNQGFTPFTIAFVNNDEGIKADAFFFTENEVIRIFEFTRSYFLVNTQDPAGLVAFLSQVMPHKRIEQLIINLGYQEWGKLLIKHQWKEHLETQKQTLKHAPGIRGMVMIVFAFEDFPMVFKMIKNKIPLSKITTREKVIKKYNLVARHDRVGRMADAQLFEHWAFPISAFDKELLNDLEEQIGEGITFKDDLIIFHQLLTERKMIPLNLFLKEADDKAIKSVVIDYGYAIKEMVMSNIFPGDLLLKNFGVTSDLKVVFYDYDEVVLLSECNFRQLPKPRNEDELWDSEFWVVVNENDVFPEELEKFMLPNGPLRTLFRKDHEDIFDIHFWNKWKEFHLNNGFIDLQPY